MITTVLDGLTWVAMLSGGFFVIVGGIGMLRFPDLFTRLHAASVTETLGAGLLLLGMLLQVDHWLVAAKLVLLAAFLLVTSPTAAHALAKAALHGGMRPFGDDRTNEYSGDKN
jgi:multicomponent Na+:H+ antiporter subunit G